MSDIPVEFTWNSQLYAGAKSSPDFSQTLEIGGQDQEIEFQIFVKADVFPVRPQMNAIFVSEGKKLKVLRVKVSPDGNLLSFQMGSAKSI